MADQRSPDKNPGRTQRSPEAPKSPNQNTRFKAPVLPNLRPTSMAESTMTAWPTDSFIAPRTAAPMNIPKQGASTRQPESSNKRNEIASNSLPNFSSSLSPRGLGASAEPRVISYREKTIPQLHASPPKKDSLLTGQVPIFNGPGIGSRPRQNIAPLSHPNRPLRTATVPSESIANTTRPQPPPAPPALSIARSSTLTYNTILSTPDTDKSINLPRGVYTKPPSKHDTDLCVAIEVGIGYTFKNRDFLLEALESPGSGITCVGTGNRQVPHGNRPIAMLGETVMVFAMMKLFYELRIPESVHEQLSSTIEKQNLVRVGKQTIECWIRPPKTSERNKLLRLIKEDPGENPDKTIVRAMYALMGAVYLDSGVEAVERVMLGLRLLIRGDSVTIYD